MQATTQHPLRHNVHNNTINNLYSIDATMIGVMPFRSYYYTDHEGISFQDPMDCTISDNVITCTATRVGSWQIWTMPEGYLLFHYH